MKCTYCGEDVAEDDRETRIQVPAGEAIHRDCALRSVVGSLGHQLGLCSCPGKPRILDDPPGLSRREAARTAAAFYRDAGVVNRVGVEIVNPIAEDCLDGRPASEVAELKARIETLEAELAEANFLRGI